MSPQAHLLSNGKGCRLDGWDSIPRVNEVQAFAGASHYGLNSGREEGLGKKGSFDLQGSPGIELLFQMPRNVFRHLEHCNLFLASKNSFEGIVSIDQRLFLCVLKFVLLDVLPDLLGHFATRKRLRPYNLGERIVGLNGFH